MKFGVVSKTLQRMREALAYKNEQMGRPMTNTGGEVHDGTPVAPPLGFVRSQSVEERIIQAMRLERMAVLAEQAGNENIAEFNDFGDDDDHYDEIFPSSRFEGPFLDAKSMGREYKRSKSERDRLEAAEDRFAEKLASRIRGDDEGFEEETPKARRPSSGARAKRGREEPAEPPSPSPEAD